MKFSTITKILLLALISQPVFAWNAQYVVDAPVRWHSDTNTVGFKLQRSTFPAGSAQRLAFMDAFNNYNNNPSNIRMRLNDDADWVSVANAVNEVWFTDNNLVLNGAPAICISHFNPFAFGVWNLMESDVVFDSNTNFTASSAKNLHMFYGGTSRSLRATASHELGHALGLHHENRLYNIMGADFSHTYANGNLLISGRGEDASEGLVRIYGAAGSVRPDIAITRWKYQGVSGEYSAHQLTDLWINSALTVPNYVAAPGTRDGGETIYQVSPGQLVWTEFTYENNGPLNLTSSVSYYISTNATITTRDRRVAVSIGQPFNRDTPQTERMMRIRVPADLTPGRYYVGAIVDSTNSLIEGDERNNAAYFPVDVL